MFSGHAVDIDSTFTKKHKKIFKNYLIHTLRIVKDVI